MDYDAWEPAGVWSRYFARMIDYTISLAIICFAIAFSLPGYFQLFPENQAGDFLSTSLVTPFGWALNAIITKVFGNSLGKQIFGISVFRNDWTSPTFLETFGRDMTVWFKALALGFPIIALFVLVGNYRFVKKGGRASWDESGDTYPMQRRIGGLRMTLGILAWLSIYAVLIAIVVFASKSNS